MMSRDASRRTGRSEMATLCLFLAPLLFVGVSAKGSQKYKTHKKVQLFANKVGPFNNPSETYQYYNLPFCKPEQGEKYKVRTESRSPIP